MTSVWLPDHDGDESRTDLLYVYDGSGNLIEKTDRLGRVTRLVYDNLYRLREEKWLVEEAVVRTFAYTYDAAGQLTQATDVASTYGYAYDGLGRVMSESQSFAGFSPLIQYNREFNAAGRVTTLSAIVGGTADFENTYVYDNLQRLTSLRQQGVYEGHAVAEKRADFAYNAAGQFTAISRYADVAGTELVANSFYAYDGIGRLLRLLHTTDTTPPLPLGEGWGEGILAGYLFAYDAGSRITSIDSYLDDLSEFEYDHTSQLVAADHTGQDDEAYEYDENGNRTMSGYSTTANNQLTTDGVYDYTYDAEGNRLTRTHIASGYVTLYSWDHRNRLIGVTEQDDEENVLSTVQYAYDPFNRRIAKFIDPDGPGGNDPTSTFFSWESDQIVLQFGGDQADDLSHRYFYGPAVDQVLMDEQLPLPVGEGRGEGEWAGDVLHLLADHLGTIRDLAEYDAGPNETTIANHRTFDSYGNITAETNSAVDTLFAFTGRELDPETGLQYHRARYYDPATGRWINFDPSGFTAGDTNLARYALNSPLVFTDRSGLVAEWIVSFTATGEIASITVAGVHTWTGPAAEMYAGAACNMTVGETHAIITAQRAIAMANIAETNAYIASLEAQAAATGASAGSAAGEWATVAYGGLAGIVVIEVAVVIAELAAIGYYTYEAYDARSDYYEMAEHAYIGQGLSPEAAAEAARQELEAATMNVPSPLELYFHYFFEDYIEPIGQAAEMQILF